MYACLAYIAEMNKKGYFDPEYVTVTTEAIHERMANHRSSFYGLSWYDWPSSVEVYVDANGNELFPILGQAVGPDGTTGQDRESVVLNYMVIPKGCEHVEDVLNYIATLCSDEVYEFLFYGKEGKQFKFDENGNRVSLNDPNDFRKEIGKQYYVYYYIYEDFEQRCNRLAYIARNKAEQKRHEIYGLQLKTKQNPAYNMPTIETYVDKIGDIDACCAEWFIKIATGAVDLDTGWKSFLKEFETLGGYEMIEAVNDWYVNQ